MQAKHPFAGLIPAFFLLIFPIEKAHAEPIPVSIYATQNRHGVWLNQIGSSVTVIGEEEIKNSGAVTVADVLRRVPGLSVNQQGGLGSLTQVRIRGSEANHVLLIVDGVKYNDPSGFGFDYSGILASNIESVEIVRGPQSGIFGSGAHAGVIAITTKSGKGLSKPVFAGHIEGGSFDTFGGSAFSAGGNGKAWGSISATGVATEGYNFSTVGTERDAANIGAMQVRLGATLTEGLNVEALLRYATREGDYDQDNFFDPLLPPLLDEPSAHYQEDDLAGYFGATYRRPGSTLEHHAEIQSYGFIRKQTDPIGPFNSDGVRNEALYRITDTFDTPEFFNGRHDISFQASHEWLNFESNFQPVHTLRNSGLAAELRSAFNNSTFFSAAVRHEISERFEDATTYRLTARQNLDGGFAVRGAIGTGVTNPTLDELFGSSASFVGNPNLKPEESFEWEIGADKNWLDSPLTTGVTYFNGVTTNEIRTIFGPTPTAVNDPGESPRQGVEIFGTYSPLPNLSFTGAYTYTHARTSTGLEEIRRPPHGASFSMLWRFLDGKGTLDAGIIYNGRMKDNDFRSFPSTLVDLDAYTLVNAQLSYQVSDQAQAYVKVQNSLDDDYQEAFGFRGQPLTVLGGMRIAL